MILIDIKPSPFHWLFHEILASLPHDILNAATIFTIVIVYEELIMFALLK